MEWFFCRLCQGSVKFNKDQIIAHLKPHRIGLEEYERDYMKVKYFLLILNITLILQPINDMFILLKNKRG